MASGFRVVVIRSTSKLDYRFGRMVVRTQDKKQEIHLDEISVLIIEDISVSLTAYLLNELNKHQVKVVFCDENHNPASELVNLYGSHDTSKKIAQQIDWAPDNKALVWQIIVSQKIENQAALLEQTGKPDKANMLRTYAETVTSGDSTNREGMAAKVYFTALFGSQYKRDDDNNIKNSFLNYGYTMINAVFNREVIASGYLTQLGIWHRGGQNPFNLSSDLMESFRPIIDGWVYHHDYQEFDWASKLQIIDLLNQKVRINEAEQTVINSIEIYTKSILNAVSSGDISGIKRIEIVSQ